MRQSKLFTKTSHSVPKDEESKNAQLLIRAGYIQKELAGVYSILPLGFRVLKKIEGIIRKEMESLDGQEILMPALQPKTNWEQTNRWETYDTLFRFESFYTKSEYALGPSHEEIVTPLLKRFIASYKDLPRAVFQIQTKFRDEKRAKAGLLRGREFIMKDLYSFHANEDDLAAYYEKVRSSYERIYAAVGIGNRTYFTFASGGTFSKYSHEFQTLTEAGEDTIFICETCKIAINEEIVKEQPECPQCNTTKLKEEKAIEVGNIFQLKTRFSECFDLQYTDEKGAKKLVVMGCYGIGLTRLLAAVVEALGDEQGLVWPRSISPFQIHIVGLQGGDEKAQEVYDKLQSQGLDVLYDDRRGESSGAKLKDADLLGIPLRLVISERTLKENAAEWKTRGQKESALVPLDKIIEKVIEMQG